MLNNSTKTGKCRSCGELYEFLYHNGIKKSNYCIKCLIKKKKAKDKKDWNKEKKEIKQELKTHSQLQNDLQKEINKLVRLIDYGHECISTGKLTEKVDAGHYDSVGSNNSLRFNLHNIFLQSKHANQHLHGDRANYRNRLESIFGSDYLDYIESLQSKYPEVKLTRDELIDKKELVQSILKGFKKEKLNHRKRITERNKYNKIIGIYSGGFQL